MVSIGTLIKMIVLAMIISIVIYTVIDNPYSTVGEERLFPGIIGDMILKNNETGKYVVESITSYDNFKGYVIQGYKANYSGSNGTMIIFIAQMVDNASASRSLKEMVIRAGYNQSADSNQTIGDNITVIKLPVDNPEVFVMKKNKNVTWHYTFSKLDNVYWVGFNGSDIQYQIEMLIEVYRNVDKVKGSFDI